MDYPKVLSASALDDHTLLVAFDNNTSKTYDIAPLLSREMFLPLRNPALFRSVEVDPGGYAVVWGDAIDISESELWRNGKELTGDIA